jgi:hypothetical protein
VEQLLGLLTGASAARPAAARRPSLASKFDSDTQAGIRAAGLVGQEVQQLRSLGAIPSAGVQLQGRLRTVVKDADRARPCGFGTAEDRYAAETIVEDYLSYTINAAGAGVADGVGATPSNMLLLALEPPDQAMVGLQKEVAVAMKAAAGPGWQLHGYSLPPAAAAALPAPPAPSAHGYASPGLPQGGGRRMGGTAPAASMQASVGGGGAGRRAAPAAWIDKKCDSCHFWGHIKGNCPTRGGNGLCGTQSRQGGAAAAPGGAGPLPLMPPGPPPGA